MWGVLVKIEMLAPHGPVRKTVYLTHPDRQAPQHYGRCNMLGSAVGLAHHRNDYKGDVTVSYKTVGL